jgi:aromatic-amino-acid transaminase
LSAEQRRAIIAALAERGAVPLIDAAYYGLGEGLEADLGFLRDAASAGRAFISVACSKSFGLYRERTGILFAICAGADERARVQGQMERISRTLVSMPPAHGAAAVATILDDPELRADWASELDEMRQRVLGLRAELAAQKVPLLAGVEHQRGIFRLLDITPEQSERLGRDHAIHMPASGRINIAGLKDGDARRLAVALQEVAEA